MISELGPVVQNSSTSQCNSPKSFGKRKKERNSQISPSLILLSWITDSLALQTILLAVQENIATKQEVHYSM